MLFKKRPSWISQDRWLRIMRQRDRRKIWRRQAVRFLKSPKLAAAYFRYRQAIDAADWPRVKKYALAVTEQAVKIRDRQTIGEMTLALERVGCYRESARLWLSEIARTKSAPNEWRGEDLSGKTLLINLYQPDVYGMGVGYRCAHVVAKLIGRARRTMAVVEPRQVPTYRRTFPALEIFTSLDDVPKDEVDFVALHEYLLAEFDLKQPSAGENFSPLLPNPEKTAQLRKKYLAMSSGGKLLVGLSWYSGHHGKDLPPLVDWRDFIARTDATFVSLQYGNIAGDLDILGRDRIIVDESIDQLVDMDSFCAQVAAMDGTISIISTLTNVSAALGVPAVVLRDDWFRRNLPVLSDRVPWYPTLRVAGKDGRAWAPVLDESFSKLRALIAERSPASIDPGTSAAMRD